MAMPMFPVTFIRRRPHRSKVRPPTRQPIGLEIAHTLAETRGIVSYEGFKPIKAQRLHMNHVQ